LTVKVPCPVNGAFHVKKKLEVDFEFGFEWVMVASEPSLHPCVPLGKLPVKVEPTLAGSNEPTRTPEIVVT